MSHLLFFRLQIVFIVRIGLDDNRKSFDDLHITDGIDLLGIIRKQFYLFDAEMMQDIGHDLVAAFIGAKTELMVRFDRIEPPILKRIGVYLVQESYVTPFLSEVYHHPVRLFSHLECEFQLITAVTLQAPYGIACKALAVHTHYRNFCKRLFEDDKMLLMPLFECLDLEVTKAGWKIGYVGNFNVHLLTFR